MLCQKNTTERMEQPASYDNNRVRSPLYALWCLVMTVMKTVRKTCQCKDLWEGSTGCFQLLLKWFQKALTYFWICLVQLYTDKICYIIYQVQRCWMSVKYLTRVVFNAKELWRVNCIGRIMLLCGVILNTHIRHTYRMVNMSLFQISWVH